MSTSDAEAFERCIAAGGLAVFPAKREELFKLRISWQTGSLEDPNQMRVARKDLARMLTVARERELAAGAMGFAASGAGFCPCACNTVAGHASRIAPARINNLESFIIYISLNPQGHPRPAVGFVLTYRAVPCN